MQLDVDVRPTQIFQTNTLQADVTLYNPTNSPIYVDTQNSVSPNTSIPINPQASLVWVKGRALWAVALAAGASLISTDNNGQLSDPSAIATALIAAGLAQDIATDVYNTGVRVLASTAPLMDTGRVSVPAFGTEVITNNADISQYSSIDFYVADENGAPVPASNEIVMLSFDWKDSATNAIVANDQVALLLGNNNGTSPSFGSIPVRGNRLDCTLTTAFGGARLLHVILLGSLRPLTSVRVMPDKGFENMLGWDTTASCAQGVLTGSLASGATVANIPTFSPADSLHLTMRYNTAVTVAGNFTVADAMTGARLKTVTTVPVGGANQTFDLDMPVPARPLSIIQPVVPTGGGPIICAVTYARNS